MSRNNFLATFERQADPLDNFSSESPVWNEVTKAWVSLEPLTGRELFNAQQVQSLVTHKSKAVWVPDMANLTSLCRMKILRTGAFVNQQRPEADENYRIFGIESVINVGEQNREVELMVKERV